MNPAVPTIASASLRTSDGVAPRCADIAVIVPTYNEVENVVPFLERAREAWQHLHWEVIFVDDDSPDGTADLVRQIAQVDTRVRIVQRLGRNGLSSACVEGMMAASAPIVAVMDADLQHDEKILPEMYRRLVEDDLELVVATRNAAGGSKVDFGASRTLLSDLGSRLSRVALKTPLSDPMSGYFMLRRSLLDELMRDLASVGFKILVDIVASARRPLRVAEVPYVFGTRAHGESKLNLNIGLEYLHLLIDKLTRGWIPARFVMFVLVGGSGVAVHLAVLAVVYRSGGVRFAIAQATATVVAMTWNFFFNNAVTFYDKQLHGWGAVRGLLLFYAACSFGAVTNIFIAQRVLAMPAPWMVAGAAGIVVSSVWNYTVNNFFTWRRRR
jgi:dolichol-phosphate mannosyltransferase